MCHQSIIRNQYGIVKMFGEWSGKGTEGSKRKE